MLHYYFLSNKYSHNRENRIYHRELKSFQDMVGKYLHFCNFIEPIYAPQLQVWLPDVKFIGSHITLYGTHNNKS